MSHEERDLQTWFEVLREGDRALALPFKPAASRRSPGRLWRFALAAAALLIVVLLAPPRRKTLPIEQLSQWRSPTESLLNVPSITR